MARRLVEHVTTRYLGAAQSLNPRQSRRKIVAYVEGYDDVLFWRSLLGKLENEHFYFEVMLPSRNSLLRGKKSALMNIISKGLGQNMIACVDADYDYLMQGATDVSLMLCKNPYVFHTYVYAIENFQCYAPALHNVCVMATLNDHFLFNFERFLEDFSRIVHPLFVWSVWCYAHRMVSMFNMQQLSQIITIADFNLYNAQSALNQVERRVNVKVSALQRQIPQAKGSYQTLREQLIELGVTPERTYLFVRGHDIFEKVVSPMVEEVCEALRKEREHEIRRCALHATQCMNELTGYQHASASPVEMLRKHSGFESCELYQRIRQDVGQFLEHVNENLPNEPLMPVEYPFSRS